jgi:hypothetical protein
MKSLKVPKLSGPINWQFLCCLFASSKRVRREEFDKITASSSSIPGIPGPRLHPSIVPSVLGALHPRFVSSSSSRPFLPAMYPLGSTYPQHKTTRTVPVSAVCPRPAGPTSGSILSLPQPFRSPLINALPPHSMVRQTQTIHDFLLFLPVPQTEHPSSASLPKPSVSSTQEDNHNQLPIRTTTCATQILISL